VPGVLRRLLRAQRVGGWPHPAKGRAQAGSGRGGALRDADQSRGAPAWSLWSIWSQSAVWLLVWREGSCLVVCAPSETAALAAIIDPRPKPTHTRPTQQEIGGDLKRPIGIVWQGCDAVAKAGLDNKAALFKGLAGVMAVLKDTLREMEELEEEEEDASSSGGGDDDGDEDGCAAAAAGGEEATAVHQTSPPSTSAAADAAAAVNRGQPAAAAANGGASGNGEAAAGEGNLSLRELADLDFDPGQLNGRERDLLTACRVLMETATAVVKALGRALLQGSRVGGRGA